MALAPGKVYANSQVRVTVHFVDPNGVDIDPNGVVFRSHDPFGNELKFTFDGTNTPQTTVIKTAAGHYFFDLLVNAPGRWFYRWEVGPNNPIPQSATVGISIGSPAVVTWPNSNLAVNTMVSFATQGILPQPIVEFINYFVIAAGLTPNTFEISLSQGGPPINTTVAGGGAITATAIPPSNAGVTVSQTSAMEGDILVQRSRFTPFDWPFTGPGGPGNDWWYW